MVAGLGQLRHDLFEVDVHSGASWLTGEDPKTHVPTDSCRCCKEVEGFKPRAL